MYRQYILPPALHTGDTIAVIRPSSVVKESYVEATKDYLTSMGYNVVLLGQGDESDGSYAASTIKRREYLREALLTTEVKVILCARGGYGAIHLIDEELTEMVRKHPKWIVGFSDITVLHCLWLKAGIMSLHAPMAKHISEHGEWEMSLQVLSEKHNVITYQVENDPANIQGEAHGLLIGGNLAVFNALAETPWSLTRIISTKPSILFIEDVGENIYEVERMLYRLRLSGVFRKLKGLIVGQFTEYRPDRNYTSMEQMIRTFLDQGSHFIPTAFRFPVGHVRCNYPIVQGCKAMLKVNEQGAQLQMKL